MFYRSRTITLSCAAGLTDKNNYRAIAVTNVDTKILERIILDNITTYDSTDTFQFGFKQGLGSLLASTTLYTRVVKTRPIECDINRGSHFCLLY